MKKVALQILFALIFMAIGFGAAILLKCRKSDEGFALSKSDSVFINSVVDVYDSFVRSKTNDTVSVKEAYTLFFQQMRKNAEGQNRDDMGVYVPDSVFLFEWTYKFVSNKYTNGLITPYYSTETLHRRDTDEELTEYIPHWGFGISDGFAGFVEQVARKNEYWSDAVGAYYAGDFPPAYYSAIAYGFDRINFENEAERFLTAIAFMGGCFESRALIFENDLVRYDSINKISGKNIKTARSSVPGCVRDRCAAG